MFLVMLLLLFKLKPFWTHSEHQEISLFKVVLCLLMCAVVCVCMCVRGHLFSEGLLCLFYVHVCDPPPNLFITLCLEQKMKRKARSLSSKCSTSSR